MVTPPRRIDAAKGAAQELEGTRASRVDKLLFELNKDIDKVPVRGPSESFIYRARFDLPGYDPASFIENCIRNMLALSPAVRENHSDCTVLIYGLEEGRISVSVIASRETDEICIRSRAPHRPSDGPRFNPPEETYSLITLMLITIKNAMEEAGVVKQLLHVE